VSEPSLPEEEEDPFWIKAKAVDVEGLSRHIRILDAAGKTPWEIRQWLLKAGCPADAADALMAATIVAKHDPPSLAGKYGLIGIVLGLIFAVAATAIYRPWTVRWVSWRTGQEIDGFQAIGLYWCGGLLAITVILGFLGSMLGAMMQTAREWKRR